MKQYNLVVTDELWNDLEMIANKEGESVVVIIRRFIKLGLLLSRQEDSHLILRTKDGSEQEIVLL